MTVREIIIRALRILKVVASGETPAAAELADGLVAFNAMVSALRGHGVGPALRPREASDGYAWAGGLHSEATLATPLEPFDGCRFGVTGACTVTTDRTIEGGTVTAPTIWFYRADLDQWIKEADATLDGGTQFPTAFDDALAALLATRLPDYGADVTPMLAVLADEAMGRLNARYRPRINPGADSGVLYLSRRPFGRGFR